MPTPYDMPYAQSPFNVTPEERKGLLYGSLISSALAAMGGMASGQEGGLTSAIRGAATGFGAYGAGLGHLTDYKRLLQEEQNKQYMFPATMEHMQAQTGRLQQETETEKAMTPYMQEYRQAQLEAQKALAQQRQQPHINLIAYRNSLANEMNNPLSDLTDEERAQRREYIKQLDAQIGPMLFSPQQSFPSPSISLHTGPGPAVNPAGAKAKYLDIINRSNRFGLGQ